MNIKQFQGRFAKWLAFQAVKINHNSAVAAIKDSMEAAAFKDIKNQAQENAARKAKFITPENQRLGRENIAKRVRKALKSAIAQQGAITKDNYNPVANHIASLIHFVD